MALPTTIMANVPTVLVATERKTTTLDAGGSPVTEYAANLSNIPMSIQWSDGGEVTGAVVSASARGVAYCDYVDIITTDRLIYNNLIYDIVSAIDVNNLGVYLKLQIVEVQPSDET